MIDGRPHTRYKIVCTMCKGSSTINIDNLDRIDWAETDRVISARKRLDGNWGFQCLCGNNDLETQQERRMIKDLGNPMPQELSDIVNNLSTQKSKFKMVEV